MVSQLSIPVRMFSAFRQRDEVIDVTKAQSEEQATEQDTNLPQALFV